MRKKIDINAVIFNLIVLFSITMIIQGIPIFDSINKLAISILLILLTIKNIKIKINKKTFIIFFITGLLYIFSIYFTEGKIENINMLFYFGLWVLFFRYLHDNYEVFTNLIKKREKFIVSIIKIWNLIIFISFFFSFSYTYTWGDGYYFKSFADGEHRLASSCIFIASLVWCVVQNSNNKKMLIYIILPIVSIYLSGARTYLGVILIFIGVIYYIMCSKKIYFFITILPIGIALIALIQFTPMADKITTTTQEGYYGLLASITSGRSIFWVADINAYNELPIINKLVGNGYNFVYDVNEIAIGSRIYAHNDIINIMLNYGLIGVIIYLYVFLNFSNLILKKYKLHGIKVWGYYTIWFFNAMFNMVYVYICAMFALPFILDSLIKYREKEKNL